MARKKRYGRWSWLNRDLITRQETPHWVVSQLHSLKHIMGLGFIPPKTMVDFQQTTGLTNFTWRVYYHRRPKGRVQPVTNLIAGAQGLVVLMHGWCGSYAIWEDLPAMVCQANPRLVCLVPDVNGFGGSPFAEAEDPLLELCGQRGNMWAVEKWLDLLKLHRPGRQRQVFTFVGHSMSGAVLFHKSTQGWEENRYSLLAAAGNQINRQIECSGWGNGRYL